MRVTVKQPSSVPLKGPKPLCGFTATVTDLLEAGWKGKAAVRATTSCLLTTNHVLSNHKPHVLSDASL